jgi:hypothetical protein
MTEQDKAWIDYRLRQEREYVEQTEVDEKREKVLSRIYKQLEALNDNH